VRRVLRKHARHSDRACTVIFLLLAVVSPLLCNVYLNWIDRAWDERKYGMCEQNGQYEDHGAKEGVQPSVQDGDARALGSLGRRWYRS
jgi:hypothetical protein